jgi:hypothetical protein
MVAKGLGLIAAMASAQIAQEPECAKLTDIQNFDRFTAQFANATTTGEVHAVLRLQAVEVRCRSDAEGRLVNCRYRADPADSHIAPDALARIMDRGFRLLRTGQRNAACLSTRITFLEPPPNEATGQGVVPDRSDHDPR